MPSSSVCLCITLVLLAAWEFSLQRWCKGAVGYSLEQDFIYSQSGGLRTHFSVLWAFAKRDRFRIWPLSKLGKFPIYVTSISPGLGAWVAYVRSCAYFLMWSFFVISKNIKTYNNQYPRKPTEITVVGSFAVTDHVPSSLIFSLLK